MSLSPKPLEWTSVDQGKDFWRAKALEAMSNVIEGSEYLVEALMNWDVEIVETLSLFVLWSGSSFFHHTLFLTQGFSLRFSRALVLGGDHQTSSTSSLGSFLEIQNLKLHSGPTELESLF